MTDPDPDGMTSLAYHEAGHAVVAAWLGAEVLFVTLEPDPDDGPRRDGDAAIRWHHRGSTPQELALRELMAVLAGPVFEMIHEGVERPLDRWSPWAADWQLAIELADRLVPSPGRVERLIETTIRQLRALADQQGFWQVIAEVADLLEAHQTLEGESVHESLGRWLGD